MVTWKKKGWLKCACFFVFTFILKERDRDRDRKTFTVNLSSFIFHSAMYSILCFFFYLLWVGGRGRCLYYVSYL